MMIKIAKHAIYLSSALDRVYYRTHTLQTSLQLKMNTML